MRTVVIFVMEGFIYQQHQKLPHGPASGDGHIERIKDNVTDKLDFDARGTRESNSHDKTSLRGYSSEVLRRLFNR